LDLYILGSGSTGPHPVSGVIDQGSEVKAHIEAEFAWVANFTTTHAKLPIDTNSAKLKRLKTWVENRAWLSQKSINLKPEFVLFQFKSFAAMIFSSWKSVLSNNNTPLNPKSQQPREKEKTDWSPLFLLATFPEKAKLTIKNLKMKYL
jgi:hypothetical protein